MGSNPSSLRLETSFLFFFFSIPYEGVPHHHKEEKRRNKKKKISSEFENHMNSAFICEYSTILIIFMYYTRLTILISCTFCFCMSVCDRQYYENVS